MPPRLIEQERPLTDDSATGLPDDLRTAPTVTAPTVTDLTVTDLTVTDLTVTDLTVTDLTVTDLTVTDLTVTDLTVVPEPVADPEPVTDPVADPVPEVNAAVVALLERSREGLRAAGSDLDARTRWAGAHLAALRAATAVLAVRGRPGPARSRPRSVWQVLPRLAPELGEWAVFLGSLQRLPERSAERRDARAADDLLRDAEQFLCAVTRVLSLPWRPVLPDVVPASR